MTFKDKMNSIIERAVINEKNAPEMVSIDWAWEHDWISPEEYSKAKEISTLCMHMADDLWNDLKLLYKESPASFNDYFRSRAHLLEKELKKLKTGEEEDDTRTMLIRNVLRELKLVDDDGVLTGSYCNTAFFWALCKMREILGKK